MRSAWQRAALVLAFVLPPSKAELYSFVSISGAMSNLYCDRTGITTFLVPMTEQYKVESYLSPTVPITVLNTEWHNTVLAGREFAIKHVGPLFANLRMLTIESHASVTVRVDGTVAATHALSARAPMLAEVKDFAGTVEIESTADVFLSASASQLHLPPVGQTIYGHCSGNCSIALWEGDPGITIERTCTDGSIVHVQAGWQNVGTNGYGGVACRWSAPPGYKISGVTALTVPAGGDGLAAFHPAEHFQLTTPVPADFQTLVLISAGPAQCSYGGSTVTLTGASGVYHVRLDNVIQTTVLECDMPVMAMGESSCPTQFPPPYSSCQHRHVNLVVAPVGGITTVTATTSTRTATNTTTATTATSTSTTTTATSTTGTTSSSTSSATTTTSTSSTTTATTTTSSTLTSTTTTPTMTSATTTTSTTTTQTTTSSTTKSATTTSTTTTPTTTTKTTTSSTTKSTTTTSTNTTTTTTTATTSSSTTTTTPTTTSTTTTCTTTSTLSTTTTPTVTTSTTTSTTSTTTSSNTSTMSSMTLSATNTTVTYTTPSITTTITNNHPVAVMLARLESLEAMLLAALIANNVTNVTGRADGLALIVTRLSAAAVAAAEGSLTVRLDGSEVAVTVPYSIFTIVPLSAEGLVLTVAKIDLATEGFAFNGSESEAQVAAAMVNVNVRSLSGRHLNVSGLVNPIQVVMPVNQSAGLQCVFWDEGNLDWATNGVELGPVGAG